MAIKEEFNEICPSCDMGVSTCICKESLSEKKTLKDLERKQNLDSFTCLNPIEVKREAIKWVKEDVIELRNRGMVSMNPIAWDLLREWMKRLNITEEDLK